MTVTFIFGYFEHVVKHGREDFRANKGWASLHACEATKRVDPVVQIFPGKELHLGIQCVVAYLVATYFFVLRPMKNLRSHRGVEIGANELVLVSRLQQWSLLRTDVNQWDNI